MFPVLEGLSSLHGKPYKNMNVALNFVSILGCEPLKLSTLELSEHIRGLFRKEYLNILSKICIDRNKKTMQAVASSAFVVDKLLTNWTNINVCQN